MLHSKRLVPLFAVVALGACAGAEPAKSAPPRAPPRSMTTSAPSVAPRPTVDPSVGHTAGVTFRVPASWVLVNEGNLSIAKSPEGDVGFVLAGYDNPSEGPAALHRADAEFATRFPVALGSQQLPLGSLPYKFVLSQSTEEKNGRLTRLSVLMGRGLKTPYLTLFAYVNVPKVSAGADSERHGRVFETIFQSFAPEG